MATTLVLFKCVWDIKLDLSSKSRLKGLKYDGQLFDGRLDHEDGLFVRLFQVRDRADVGMRLVYAISAEEWGNFSELNSMKGR